MKSEKMKTMIAEVVREKLIRLHNEEDDLNHQMNYLQKQIMELEKEKKKLAKRISYNMKYRNKLINS